MKEKILQLINHENKEPFLPITLSRKMRWIVFSLLIYISTIMELDQGVLSSTTDSLSKDMELNDSQLGGLGSMIFLGKALGCLIFFTLINKLNRKYMLLVTSFLTILSLILTTQTKKLFLLYFYRIIAGISQSYLGIYSPVWADQFGIHKYKSIILSCQHLSSSLGYLFGYMMGIWLGWILAFYVEDVMLVLSLFVIFFISDKFFSMSLMPIKSRMNFFIKDNFNIQKVRNNVINDCYNNTKEESINIEDDISLFEDIQKQGENMSKDSIILQIKAIIKSPLFILINITLCSIYAIVAAIQFWINDYMQYSLHITKAKTRFIMFGSIIITSPPLGMIIGGIILSKAGGYESEKAIYIPLFASLVVSILANLAPLSSNAYIFLPLFWIYFFSGSMIIPSANGISLVSVEKKYAGAASSMSIFLYNVFGRFPGPNLYAFFKSVINDDSSRKPMWLLLNVSLIGFFAVLFAIKYNKKKFINLREEFKGNNDINEDKEILFMEDDDKYDKDIERK